jgi:ABC-type multidrug transport system ATPase subunit
MISLYGVTKTYGPVRALVNVTCTLAPSAITVLRGPNGSGKSTLLAVVGTMARPTAGRLDHGELGRSRRDVRSTLGWVGHDSLCYPDLTGRQNIELAATLHGCSPDQAFIRAAERFDLTAFANRAFRTYSRGQRQRVALARALVHSPRLLLLDEPTTGLDAGACERLVRVLHEETARGATVVLSTHDSVFASEVANAIVALDRGRVVTAA